jgi:hypothetical protein
MNRDEIEEILARLERYMQSVEEAHAQKTIQTLQKLQRLAIDYPESKPLLEAIALFQALVNADGTTNEPQPEMFSSVENYPWEKLGGHVTVLSVIFHICGHAEVFVEMDLWEQRQYIDSGKSRRSRE